jgi:hypothetical protein
MSLDATIGGTASNSYCTVAFGDSYFGDRLNSSEWTGASNGDKEKALITATRRIDEESFLGFKVSSHQSLKWPRVQVYDEDGIPFDTDTIPERVKQATYLTALELLKADFLAEDYLNNFEFLSTGTMQFKQFTQKSAGRLPSEASRLLRLVMTSGAGSGRIVRA